MREDQRTSSSNRSTSTTRSNRPSRQNSQRTFQVIKWIFVILTFALIGWSIKLITMDREEILANENNPVIEVMEERVLRGSIFDRSDKLLAYTKVNEDDGNETRIYPYGESAAHVVGYTGRGNSGLEARLEKDLFTDAGLADQVAYWVTAEKTEGNSAKLTLDADLTQFIYEQLEGYSGAVVITEPSTGAVRVLASSPSFDPESVVDDWESIAEREDGPLYSRALQGLYAPGSTMKIITALAMYRHMPDYMDREYVCESYLEVEDQRLYCAGEHAHGWLDLPDAFAYSCNGFFAEAGVEMGKEALQETADYLHVGDDFGFILPQSESTIGLEEYEADSMLAQTSIGQGRVLLSPFYLNMLTCSIANGGVLYAPYLVDEIRTPSGRVVSKNLPKLYGTIMQEDEAAFLADLMEGVCSYGTGSDLYLDGYTIYGKTGTAQVEGGADHSWFTGYIEKDGKSELVITVLIENGGYEKRAVPLVYSILEHLST